MLYFECFALVNIASCHIESHGKNNGKSLITDFIFFLHIELFVQLCQPISFQKLSKILQNGVLVTIAFFTHPVVVCDVIYYNVCYIRYLIH